MEEREPIIQPIIDELKNIHRRKPAPAPVAPPRPSGPEPAESDQDAGGGYNPDHTNPQT